MKYIFAFLFLVNNDINFSSRYKHFFKNNNIYIHPKYPKEVHKDFQKYIIDKLIDTAWGTISIVDATINLLEQAYLNKDNEWFILLSQDSYPLYKQEHFYERFTKILNNSQLSIFNYKEKKGILWKTSQWFILNRKDVKIILENHIKYKKTFKKPKLDAPDEVFFLSLLNYYVTNYKFINSAVMYDRWIIEILKHPIIFNKITLQDIKIIKKQNSLFIRKVGTKFTVKPYIPKKNLYILTIGDKTNQEKNYKYMKDNNLDYIIISFLETNKLNKNIVDGAIQIIVIFWSLWLNCISTLITKYKSVLEQWNAFIIIPEHYNLQVLNINNYKHYEEKPLLNIKFWNIIDDNKNIALYKNK